MPDALCRQSEQSEVVPELAYTTPYCPCGGRFQTHPQDDDLRVCAECGNEWMRPASEAKERMGC